MMGRQPASERPQSFSLGIRAVRISGHAMAALRRPILRTAGLEEWRSLPEARVDKRFQRGLSRREPGPAMDILRRRDLRWHGPSIFV